MCRINNASKRAALYLRLSKEDGAAESSSIATQRSLLKAYATEHGLRILTEYVDDGYSGTNFDRPAFRRMLRDIDAGKIDTVLTKDLSRLGRDYITAGQFTEQFFPARGIRYIAVNDGYDSARTDGDIVPFRNIMNEMYARDISKKIRSAFRAKMREGKHIAAFAPYGYQKDPNDRNRLIIDPLTGPTVRKIFSDALSGRTPAAIAAALNAAGCPAPLAQRALSQGKAADLRSYPPWSAATITKMLHNEVYCGHLVQGKSTKPSFKSQHAVPVSREAQITVRCTHPPLIDADGFFCVQRLLRARTRPKAGRFANRFAGLARCADCQNRMSSAGTRRKGSPAVLTCGAYKLHGRTACSNHFIDYRTLETIVSAVLSGLLHLSAQEQADIVSHALTAAGTGERTTESERRRLQSRLDAADSVLAAIYEDHACGRIDADTRHRLTARYAARQQQLRQGLQKIDADSTAQGTGHRAQERLAAALRTLCRAETCPDRLLFSLIDRIEIGQGSYEPAAHGRIRRQEITIHLRFQSDPTMLEFRF